MKKRLVPVLLFVIVAAACQVPPQEPKEKPFDFRLLWALTRLQRLIPDFRVQDADNTWVEIEAVLMAETNRAKVWIAGSSYTSVTSNTDYLITTTQAQLIADKFDQVYAYTKEIFGRM